jgi:mycofactocin system creatininase family protein
VNLGSAAWPQVAARAAASILVVPLGSTEQHGPHLPLSTDTDVAVALAEGVAAARPGVVVAPALPYGSSGEHAGFAGTLSIGQEAFEAVVIELVRSAGEFAAVLLVSGHGGNAEPLRRAVAKLRAEGRRVAAWSPRTEMLPLGVADAHAGRLETSLLLAIAPGTVHLERTEAGNIRPMAELEPLLRAGGVRAVSPNGVLGDPAGASAGEGSAALDALVADLVAVFDALGVARPQPLGLPAEAQAHG